MNASQLIDVLLGRWRLILVVTALATGLTLLACWLLPKKYTATAEILVDARSADAMATAPVERTQASNQALMATQVEVITSGRVARRVVAILKLEDTPPYRERWQREADGRGELNNYIADDLLARLDVRPARDSNVITLSYPAKDATFATAVVNAFAQASLETNLELKVEPARQYSTWFNERSEMLRKELEQAQAKLTDYQRQQGVMGGTPGQIDIESAKLTQLASQLLAVQASRAESRSRQQLARDSASTSPDVMGNAVIAGLRADISSTENQLVQLNSQYGDRHPAVISARERIASLKTQLANEMQVVARSVHTSDTVNEQRENEARAALAAQRTRVFALMNGSNEVAVLQHNVDSAQRALDAAMTRQSQTALESQVQQTNVYLLAPAVEPHQASFPKVKVFTASAAAFGLLIGIALALWRESRQPLIRSLEDLSVVVDLPVLASLPRAIVASRPRARLGLRLRHSGGA